MVCLMGSVSAGVDLGGRKDQVIKTSQRDEVLELAVRYLEAANADEFLSSIEDLKNPFVFEQPVEELVQVEVAPAEPEPTIVYDNASVLDAVAKGLVEQIRGTMGMGDNYYMQLETGGLMKKGASFPAKIPDVEDQTFTVTVTDVTEDGFELKLGDSVKSYTISDLEAQASGSVQFYGE